MANVIHLLRNEAELAEVQDEMGWLLEISNAGPQRTAEPDWLCRLQFWRRSTQSPTAKSATVNGYP